MSEILQDFLFIGGEEDLTDTQWLDKNEITHILNCAKEVSFPRNYKKRFKCLKLNMEDSEDQKIIPEYCEQAFNFIDDCYKKGGKILINCRCGISRSVSMTIAYLMMKFCLSFRRALNMIKNIRDFVNPNDGFREQLKLLQDILTCR